MKKIILIAILAALVCVCDAGAGWRRVWQPGSGCYRGSWGWQWYDEPHVAPVVETRFIVTYDPAAAELIALAKQQQATIDRLLQSAPPQAPAPGPLDGRAVLTRSCLTCHGSQAAAEKAGTGFTLDPARISGSDLKRIVGYTASVDPGKRCPPGKPLAAGELAAVKAIRPDAN